MLYENQFVVLDEFAKDLSFSSFPDTFGAVKYWTLEMVPCHLDGGFYVECYFDVNSRDLVRVEKHKIGIHPRIIVEEYDFEYLNGVMIRATKYVNVSETENQLGFVESREYRH